MTKFKYLPKKEINKLPSGSGVYAFKKGKKVLYIGKAANLRERVKNHFQQPTYRDSLFINQVSKIDFIKTGSAIEALILEANLIKKYKPKYNVAWRDDKNYFYVGITKENFPKVFITHQIQNSKVKSQNHNSKFKTVYVGPFVDGSALKQTLKILRKVFPYRSCNKIPKHPCLWYQLNRCPAPCLLKTQLAQQIPQASLRVKNECQRNAKNLMKILQKGGSQVLKDLKKEMEKASTLQNFEKAAKIRDQISALEKVMSHAKVFNQSEEIVIRNPLISYYNREWEKVEKELKKILQTKLGISRIEAYDISNLQGNLATGSMIAFINGKPDKNFYRRFKIKYANSARSGIPSRNANAHMRIRKPNDIAMIQEVLSRRLKHREWPYPQLILIDGGKNQLNAALTIKNLKLETKYIKVIALAKKRNPDSKSQPGSESEKLFIEGREKPILLKNIPQETANLLLQLRDEAHRFARKYHLKLREVDFLPQL